MALFGKLGIWNSCGWSGSVLEQGMPEWQVLGAVVLGKQYTQEDIADSLMAQLNKKNNEDLSTGEFLKQVWEHFYFELPNSCHQLYVDFNF